MDHEIKVVPNGEGGSPDSRSRGQASAREQESALSQELDSLFQFLVERAHDAVDRLAERAVPALGQLADNLAHGAERVGLSGHSGDAAMLHETDGRQWGGGRETSTNARQYLGIVRKHPIAALALAVAAGVVIRQIRTR